MKITNNLNLHPIIAVWLAENGYSGSNDATHISTTGLLRSTRQQVLLRKCIREDCEVAVDISTLMKSKMGTAIHKCIEEAWKDPESLRKACETLGWSDSRINRIHVNPEEPIEGETNVYFEQRAHRDFNGWRINGEFDCVLNGTVIDFKSTTTYTYMNKTKEQDYIKQLSIYRWLNPELITDDIGIIQFIFTDWNQKYALGNPDYPQHPFVMIKLPLMSLEETESFIATTLRNIDYYTEHEDELPMCDDHALMINTEWQYFASGDTSKRSSKNFKSYDEAVKYMASKGNTGIIKRKAQEPKGCTYCACRDVCTQYTKFKQMGLIK